MKITDSELYQSVPKAEELWLSRLPPDEKIPEHTHFPSGLSER